MSSDRYPEGFDPMQLVEIEALLDNVEREHSVGHTQEALADTGPFIVGMAIDGPSILMLMSALEDADLGCEDCADFLATWTTRLIAALAEAAVMAREATDDDF